MKAGESYAFGKFAIPVGFDESLMLGAFTLMTGADNGDCSKRDHPKMTDIHLGFSRDGFHFSRAEDRSPFIAASRKAGTWDRGYLHSNAALCLVDGDELRFVNVDAVQMGVGGENSWGAKPRVQARTWHLQPGLRGRRPLAVTKL